MTHQRVLLTGPNDWRSPFQVGVHNLAREFARLGWDVAFISDPISPFHLCRGLTAQLHRRASSWWHGGRCEDGVWSYVPAAALTPHNQPLLRAEVVHRHWHRWTLPNVVRQLRRAGFASVDLLLLNSLHQSFWADVLPHRRAVYRIADYNPQFEKYTVAARRTEEEMARRADLVLYASRGLRRYAEELGARRTMFYPNGVDYEHYARAQPPPSEYATIRPPRAVYMGVIPEWFHFEWVAGAALALPGVSFVLVGPERLARARLGGLPNVHILGTRDNAVLPAYLQHAQVGLMPFDAACNPEGVAVLSPQKLYAYLASGLPVVSSDWEELRGMSAPVRRCASGEELNLALQQVLANPGPAEERRWFAARHSWRGRVADLLAALDTEGAAARSA